MHSATCGGMRVLIVATVLASSLGFSPPVTRSSRPGLTFGRRARDRSTVSPAQLNQHKNSDDDDSEDTVNEEPSSRVEVSDNDSPPKRAFRAAFNVFGDITSAFFFTVSAVTSMGLLLNLCGYGYTLSPSEGLRIETIEKLRTERQFEAEFDRIGRSTSQPPSALPK